MKKLLLTLLLFLLLPVLGNTQVMNSIRFHNSFELSDSVQTIELNLVGKKVIKHWAGNTILIESKIESEDAPDRLLKYFKDRGRYDMTGERKASAFSIISNDLVRETITTKYGEIQDTATVSIFLPEKFKKVTNNNYRKTN